MEVVEILNKYIVPLIAIIISIVGVFKGWVYRDERMFNQREKTSKFIYELYKNSGEGKLKHLAIEYGYAAITKDNHLSFEQRKALLQSQNPVRDIDAFRKCSSLLTITTHPLSFQWKAGRHKFKLYRFFVCTCNMGFYFIGGFISVIPLFYWDLLPIYFAKKILLMEIGEQMFLTLSSVFFGVTLSFSNLNNFAKIKMASDLRKRHMRQ
ncbi:hypothetical protein [Pectobacterium sp. CHL-2024]|uniref:hypothetical protein n=1 Tax=Pectobacterium sp. CHL-2024 TaxID=3377079 RepID=UPI0037FF9589